MTWHQTVMVAHPCADQHTASELQEGFSGERNPSEDGLLSIICLFRDFGDWDSPVAHPSGRDLARFMQQRQPLVAAFIHYCFLARVDPERAGEIVPVDLSVSETDSSELVEVSN
jgi:hypothetical protein